jgi:hypothetical protein
MKHGAYPPDEVVQAVVYRYPGSAISGASLRMDAHMKNERSFGIEKAGWGGSARPFLRLGSRA